MLNNKNIFKNGQESLSAENFIGTQQPALTSATSQQCRKPYRKPRLENLGDLRALTFGSLCGVTDSGGFSQELPPALC